MPIKAPSHPEALKLDSMITGMIFLRCWKAYSASVRQAFVVKDGGSESHTLGCSLVVASDFHIRTWLSLYFLLTHINTTALPSTALAIASRVDPDIRSTSIQV